MGISMIWRVSSSSWGYPMIFGWFIMENPSVNGWFRGYLHFRKPPYVETFKKIEKCFLDVSSMVFTCIYCIFPGFHFFLIYVWVTIIQAGVFEISLWIPLIFTDDFKVYEKNIKCYNWIQHLYLCTRTHTHTRTLKLS